MDKVITFADELHDLDQKGLRRKLRPSLGALLNFSSNNYLGLARDPRVVAAAKEAIDTWGSGATSSRLLSGTTELHQKLEDALARFLGREAALVFPSGYMANLAAITTLVGPSDAIVMDRLCHASLVDAARLSRARLFVYKHADAEDAERVLARNHGYRRRLLLTESLFSMDGDFAPLPALLAAAQKHEALSVVDEAHALGVWGPQGRGLAAVGEGVTTGWDVVLGTLSKSFGSQGGVVASSREFIDLLISKARSFIFTTGLAPASVGAALKALEIIEKADAERVILKQRSSFLLQQLKSCGLNTLQSRSQIIPAMFGSIEATMKVAAALENKGIYAPAIRPPTVPAGECRIRFSLTTEHTDEHLKTVIQAMKGVL